ncbi:MAG: bifunctional glutamate N-acetyltransferase/amino-acid acetyltransferase ArgJ [Saccharofermentanales bacterium]
MNEEFQITEGSVTSPKGFYAAGVACGLKKTGDLDLALVVSDPPADACGVFTRNLVKGHSLRRSMDIIGKSKINGVIINSGNANACVGIKGEEDAQEMASILAECLSCEPANILTGSTGVIGKPLPMAKIRKGILKAVSSLSCEVESGHLAELAIMTTDLCPKERSISFAAGQSEVTISAMAKGSGMIHPNMATMIAIITTDCNIRPALLRQALAGVVDRSFNRISVDGDTSVCDMVVMLANGCAGNAVIDSDTSREYRKFQKGLEIICTGLSKDIAADGEGATKLLEIRVLHAKTADDAFKVLQAVSRSPLVKTAMFGEDANWGRILTAAGYSGADFNPDRCTIRLGNLTVCSDGTALDFDEAYAKEILQEHEIIITVDLSEGEFNDTMWTCDFSYDYIKINGSYRS